MQKERRSRGRLELQIEDIAFGGKGVARDRGKAVFVPFTIDGERISARIVREKKQFAEAELLQLLEASPRRTKPACPYFGRCGGCSYQHITYEHQLDLKQRQVEQILRRIGRVARVPLRAIIPSPAPYHYRNRITVHAQDGIVGFFRREAHQLMDIRHCPIAQPEVNQALADLRRARVRDGHYTLRAEASPRIFAQANDAVAHLLREIVAGLIEAPQRLLIDAYCGSGFFAKNLLARFEQIVGIDWDRFAIDAAQRGASAKENYIAGDVDAELRRLLESAELLQTVVLADPPASGLMAQTRAILLEFPPATLIYVSCNPPTLARDLAQLQERFSLESVTPLDMFPQTAGIECVAHLKARSL